jgi:hypothetical protein
VSRTPEKWRRAEIESDMVMKRIAGTREILRVLSAITEADTRYAQQLLMLALVETKLAYVAHSRDPITVLIPPNHAVLGWMLEERDILTNPRSARKLMDIVRDYVILGLLPLKPGKEADLKTARGGDRKLTWLGNLPLIDGVALRPPGFPLGANWSYPKDGWAFTIDGILPSSRGNRRRRYERRQRQFAS